jgi:hypothetical protein
MHTAGASPFTTAVGSDDDAGDAVEPAPRGAAEQDDVHSEHWEFSRRAVGPGRSSSGHFRPTRHASLDAGYLQQRVYAAAHVLDRPGAGDAHAAAGTFGGADKGARRGSDTTPNEGIEIAWVSYESEGHDSPWFARSALAKEQLLHWYTRQAFDAVVAAQQCHV